MTRKTKRNIVIAALVLGIGFAAYVATGSAQAPVTFKDIGYSTVDDTQAEVDYQVTKYPGATAKCAIKALDSKFAVVGWKVVEIGPNDPPGRSRRRQHHHAADCPEDRVTGSLRNRGQLLDRGQREIAIM